MKFAVACCGILLILLSSCSKERETEETLERSEHRVLEGSVEENVLKVQNDPWAGDCEKKIRDVQIEIARELDRRAPEIAALPPSAGSSASAKKVNIGSMSLIELTKIPSTDTAWNTDFSSWDEIISEYQKIKGTPTDGNWRWLNSYARGVLLDDVGRVYDGFNYGLDKDSQPGLTLLRDAIAKCDADSECIDPDLTTAASFLAGQPYYDSYINRIKKSAEKQEKRERIARFLKRVTYDLKPYEFRTNELMLSRNGSEFILPLDAGAFTGLTAEIQAYIESAWSSATGKSVKVEWRNKESSPLIFHFLYKSSIGERAFVSFSNRTINLFPNSSNSTVAHEIGHVMGFRDTYYTVWDEKNCRYTSQYRKNDIMSQHQTGVVLPEHWEKLQQEYPLTTR